MSCSDAYYESMKEKKNKEIKQLKKDLKKYGRHKPGCNSLTHSWGICSCGFEKALEG